MADCYSSQIVYFDLETTGLRRSDEIIQIAASTSQDDFNVYIYPSKNIRKRTTEVNGFYKCNRVLYHKGAAVHTETPVDAFKKFLKYLRSFRRRVLLVAHNAFRFDAIRITDLAQSLGLLSQFENVVCGFSDSLIVLKNHFIEEGCAIKSFYLRSLIEAFLPDEYLKDWHNAAKKVVALRKIVENCLDIEIQFRKCAREVGEF